MHVNVSHVESDNYTIETEYLLFKTKFLQGLHWQLTVRITYPSGHIISEQDQNATKDLNISASMIFRPMDLMKQMISVACGKEHALLLSSSGEVYSLGNGRYMVGSEIGWLFNTGSIWQSNTHLKFLVTSWPKVVARKCSPFFNGLGKKRMNVLDILRSC